MANLFVYGSLRSEKVLRALLRRVPKTMEGVLYCKDEYEYVRYALKPPAPYPVVIREKKKSNYNYRKDDTYEVDGLILCDLDEASMTVLDEFEGDLYRRIPVEVKLKENGRIVRSESYIVLDEERSEANRWIDFERPWSFDEFCEPSTLDAFLRECVPGSTHPGPLGNADEV